MCHSHLGMLLEITLNLLPEKVVALLSSYNFEAEPLWRIAEGRRYIRVELSYKKPGRRRESTNQQKVTSARTEPTSGSTTTTRRTEKDWPRQVEKAVTPAPSQPKEQPILLDTPLRRNKEVTVVPSPLARGPQQPEPQLPKQPPSKMARLKSPEEPTAQPEKIQATAVPTKQKPQKKRTGTSTVRQATKPQPTPPAQTLKTPVRVPPPTPGRPAGREGVAAEWKIEIHREKLLEKYDVRKSWCPDPYGVVVEL